MLRSLSRHFCSRCEVPPNFIAPFLVSATHATLSSKGELEMRALQTIVLLSMMRCKLPGPTFSCGLYQITLSPTLSRTFSQYLYVPNNPRRSPKCLATRNHTPSSLNNVSRQTRRPRFFKGEASSYGGRKTFPHKAQASSPRHAYEQALQYFSRNTTWLPVLGGKVVHVFLQEPTTSTG